MSKHRRTTTTVSQDPLLNTIHHGFNYFHELDFRQTTRQPTRRKWLRNTRGAHSHSVMENGQRTVADILHENKQAYSRIKTELSHLRDCELNDYIKKSMKYQEILNINDNKKKRLPTLNAKIGEVVKKSVIEVQSKNIQYYLTTTPYRLDSWKPESREGHTTTLYKNLAIVIGGHCSAPFTTAQVYSFDTHTWIRQFNVSSARSYHSAIFYKNRFIITFGGMGTYDISRKCRVCFNTINLIDLQTWSSRMLKMSNQESIEGRRSHGAVLMGKYMVIFGGMNTKRQFLSDFVYLDLKELRWYHKEYKVEGKQLSENIMSGIARHKMLSHFKGSHKTLPLYSSEYADDEGVYVVGGTYGNGEDNIISFISFNKYNPCIRRVDYSGIPPSSVDPVVERVNQNIIMIISGQIHERRIKLFTIKEKEFVDIYKNHTPPCHGGLGSSLTRYNDEIYIMFGLGAKGYISTVYGLQIEEKITESEAKKKKPNRAFMLEWNIHKDNMTNSSQSDSD